MPTVPSRKMVALDAKFAFMLGYSRTRTLVAWVRRQITRAKLVDELDVCCDVEGAPVALYESGLTGVLALKRADNVRDVAWKLFHASKLVMPEGGKVFVPFDAKKTLAPKRSKPAARFEGLGKVESEPALTPAQRIDRARLIENVIAVRVKHNALTPEEHIWLTELAANVALGGDAVHALPALASVPKQEPVAAPPPVVAPVVPAAASWMLSRYNPAPWSTATEVAYWVGHGCTAAKVGSSAAALGFKEGHAWVQVRAVTGTGSGKENCPQLLYNPKATQAIIGHVLQNPTEAMETRLKQVGLL